METESYIPYPRARKQLSKKLGGVSHEEVAIWIWMGPENGGLNAYLNANELQDTRQFCYGEYMVYAIRQADHDYVKPMMACWFKADDIANFQPSDRYMTGETLLERWGQQADIKAREFMRAKIEESRLQPLHPLGIDDDETSLFAMSEIEAIEIEDFGEAEARKGNKPTIAGEKACFYWLRDLMSTNSPPAKKKTNYYKESKDRFNISRRGFDRVWAEVIIATGNTAWSQPGRKRKSNS